MALRPRSLLRVRLLAHRHERTVGRNPDLERPRRDFARDDDTLVDVDAVMDAGVDPGFTRLTAHREIAPALVRKLRVQHETDRSRDASVVARIGRMVRYADRQADFRIRLRRA